nr:beta-galactosidase [Paenibacillus roseus]
MYGVCYYPEHWDEELWDDDFRRMREMGINVVRMGETAWNLWEPEEDVYSFDVFDRAIELCESHGLKVILGTPTYAPPAWLTAKYPESLRQDFYGNVMHHGSRRHVNYTSRIFLEKCENIVAALAEHYKNRESVIGWQIDNELNCHMDVSFADSDREAFREWCRAKYGGLAELNIAWGTAFWAQTYTDWSQVDLPRPTATYHSPGHLLDFYRFTSDSAIGFAKLQYDVLKRANPETFVTHNGLFDNIDFAKLTEEALDFISFDSYPAFALMQRKSSPEYFKDRIFSMKLSRVRGLSSKFIILEQQAGPGGQSGSVLLNGVSDYLHKTPKPGQMRLWAWQSVAHGADGLLFFRWRTCPFGAETLWHGLNNYGNQPNRRLEEAKQLGQEFEKTGPLLIASDSKAQAAILYDYDNDSNNKIDGYIGQQMWRSEELVYQALNERHIMTDVIPNTASMTIEDLSQYKLVICVNAQLLDEEDAAKLHAYAQGGGTVVFGPRSGYKNRNNTARMLPLPGILRELTGVEIHDYTMVDESDDVGVQFEGTDTTVNTFHFNEVLEAKGEHSEVVARYTSDYYEREAAIVRNAVGDGVVIYSGTVLTVDTTALILDSLHIHDSLADWVEAPKEIEVVRREHADEAIYIFLNYLNKPVPVKFNEEVIETLSGNKLEGLFELQPYDVLFIRRKESAHPKPRGEE